MFCRNYISIGIKLLAFIVASSLYAGSFKFDGYSKKIIYSNNTEESEVYYLNNIRANIDWAPSTKFATHFAYQISPALGKADGFLPEYKSTYRAYDFNDNYFSREYSHLFSNLDRAYVTFSVPLADLKIGRQGIKFGSGRLSNPTNIIAPFKYNALNKEYVHGVDSARMSLPFSDDTEFQFGAIFGDKFEITNGAAFVRPKFNVLKVNLALTVMLFQENELLGIDITKKVANVELWFEAAYVWMRNQNDNYFSLTTGSEYKYNEVFKYFFEYHYNGAMGKTSPYVNSGIFLMNKHYLSIGTTYMFDTKFMFKFKTSVNEKGSCLISPHFEVEVADSTSVDFGSHFSLGNKSLEFGQTPNIFYLSLKHYF